MYSRNLGSLLVIISYIGCTEPYTPTSIIEEEETPLHLYMHNDLDDGYYRFDYPNGNESSYTAVEYITEPITRVFWYSEDTFTFIYWGREMTYPIINNSTYSGADGNGRQLIYLYEDFIGDTLSVVGCIDDNCQSLEFIVDE